jgi:hypothetical protein
MHPEKKFSKALIRVIAVVEDSDEAGDRIYCMTPQWNHRYAFSWPKSFFPIEMSPLLKEGYRFMAEVDFLSSDHIEHQEFLVRNFEMIDQKVPTWEELAALAR